MNLQLVKMYCGMGLWKVDDGYACINKYTKEIIAAGTKETCDKAFNNYVAKIAERD